MVTNMKTRNLLCSFFILDVLLLSTLMLFMSYYHYGGYNYMLTPVSSLLILFNFGWFVSTLIFIDDIRNLKLGLSLAFKTQVKKFVVFVSIVSVGIIPSN